jgi:O-antigen ligase/tetratricopeptide (TPR) repeat protein
VGSQKKKRRLKTEAAQVPAGMPAATKAGRLQGGSRFPFSAEEIVLGSLFFGLIMVSSDRIIHGYALPKLIVLYVCTAALIVLWLFRYVKGETRALPKTVFLSILGLSAWWVLSSFFAIHVPTALYGMPGRYNGLFTHLAFAALFLTVASLPLGRNGALRILRILAVFLAVLSVHTLLLYYQVGPFRTEATRPYATIGNPVPLAAIIGLGLPFSVAALFTTNGRWPRILWGGLSVLYLSAALSTVSRGPLVGIAVSFMVIIAGLLVVRRLNLRKAALAGAVALVALIVVVALNYRHFEQLASRFKPILTLQVDLNTAGRLLDLKAALLSIREHPVTGAGFEHFRIVYPRFRTAEEERQGLHWDITPTMVHNGYAQTALDNGVPALLLYLMLVGSVVVVLLRRAARVDDPGGRILSFAFLAAIAGYLVQDLSGWLEIPLTSLFWLVLGLAVASCLDADRRLVPRGRGKAARFVAGGLAVLFFATMTVVAARRLYVEHLLWETMGMRDLTAVEANISRALRLVSGDAFYEDFAGTVYDRWFGATRDRDAYTKARELYERAHRDNPNDVYILLHGILLDALAIERGVIERPSPFVDEAAKKVLAMDKNNGAVHAAVGKLWGAEKRYPEALAQILRAKELRPREFAYYIIELRVLQARGSLEERAAYYRGLVEDLEKKGDRDSLWLAGKLTLTQLLLEQGRDREAIQQAQDIIERNPGEQLAHMLMGAAYAGLGQLDAAQQSLDRAYELDGDNPFVLQARQQLEQMRLRRR